MEGINLDHLSDKELFNLLRIYCRDAAAVACASVCWRASWFAGVSSLESQSRNVALPG